MMKPEETIDFHIRWPWLRTQLMFSQLPAPNSLAKSIGFVLLNVDPKMCTPAMYLCPRMGADASSLSRMFRNMEEKGWVERKPDSKDERINRVYLTNKGEELRNISRDTVVTFNQEILPQIPPDRLKHFFELLSIVDRNITNRINSAQ